MNKRAWKEISKLYKLDNSDQGNDRSPRYGAVKPQRRNEECSSSECLPVIAASRGIVISKFNPEAEQEAG
ncbi:hypothetical protein K0M31_020131 [Melipona bicolor]|uniref:Uncharacterized protein n=1 Tax=Melipona bicolor TaxID=60889 RepID=A0AA40KQH7_9HYME|nr:hypothetical protein K0M31_020131 [Melipona bicolor]